MERMILLPFGSFDMIESSQVLVFTLIRMPRGPRPRLRGGAASTKDQIAKAGRMQVSYGHLTGVREALGFDESLEVEGRLCHLSKSGPPNSSARAVSDGKEMRTIIMDYVGKEEELRKLFVFFNGRAAIGGSLPPPRT